jgi:L-asparaginase/Glu-tRNA(Gln) amidotransferase subunit D
LAKPLIAVFSGPTATIQNSEPLVTSNLARAKHGLPLRQGPDGLPLKFDVLRPQRLAAPVTVYVEQFTAHPLERDAAELYGPPDGYLDASGAFHPERQSPHDRPVYEVQLRPEDGLFMLPYMARQANGQPWDDDSAYPGAPAEFCRQPHYADASRVFEEIDRFGVGDHGVGSLLSSQADFEFYRAAPSGGYTKGRPAADRTDVGEGDIEPETRAIDFFGYRPTHLPSNPTLGTLARLTNVVQAAMASGRYAAGFWLEGSPSVEETSYWLHLVIDTQAPLVGMASQRAHGAVANDGDRNLIDAVGYVGSRVWADDEGRDTIGGVVIQDEQIFTAREVQKADARPGGYTTTGGHGGVVGSIKGPKGPVLTFRPLRKHTYRSEVNLSRIPTAVTGVRTKDGLLDAVAVQVKDGQGRLIEAAMPRVVIAKSARYLEAEYGDDPASEVDLLARIEQNLREAPLAGFVGEGTAPFASMTGSVKAALRRAALSGMPVVLVGRGNAEGFASPARGGTLAISGSNLTATKARLLLTACLLRLGALPPARDPANPTPDEIKAIQARLAEYQAIFDTH